MFKEKEIVEPKKSWLIVLGIILVVGLLYVFFWKDPLYLNEREVSVHVNKDGSIKVEEIWDIDIRDTSTLFITFDRNEGSAFNDVLISYHDGNQWKKMTDSNYIASDGKEKENYFHTGIFQGMYEIAWGTGLEKGRGNRKYKIEYTKDMTFFEFNSVNKYNDIAEFYHQFVGQSFEIPIKKFKANISFEETVNKDNAKIWGHGDTSGQIDFDNGGVLVRAENVKANTMVEGRVLFPIEFIPFAETNRSIDGEDKILAEENYNASQTYTTPKFSLNGEYAIYMFSIAYVLIVGLLIIKINKLKKQTEELPGENIREWEVFSDVPTFKLDFLYANVISYKKPLTDFINTIIMKLSFNKYLNIFKKEDVDLNKLEENQKIQKDMFLAFSKRYEDFNLNKLNEDFEKFIGVEKEFTLTNAGGKRENFNNLVYVLDLKRYKEKQLDEDEQFVFDILISAVVRSFMNQLLYNTSKSKRITVNIFGTQKLKLATKEWKLKETLFKEFIIEFLDELYIEQFFILNHMYSQNLEIEKDYNLLNDNRKKKMTEENIFSKPKEKILNSLRSTNAVNYIAIASGTYFLTQILGPVIFNREIYLGFLVMTFFIQIILKSIGSKIKEKVDPPLTEVGLNNYYEMSGLRNFLSNSSYISEYDEKSIIIWGEFLVFATYFGITASVLEALKNIRPEVINEMENTTNYYAFNNALTSYSSFSTATSRTFSSARAASSGGGGGFSSGGGGGGGGGRRWRQIINELD